MILKQQLLGPTMSQGRLRLSKPLLLIAVALITTTKLGQIRLVAGQYSCNEPEGDIWPKKGPSNCSTVDSYKNNKFTCGNGYFANLLIYGGVFCPPNSAKCKAFTGRVEFEMDIAADKMIGTVASTSPYVDENGFHARVPVSYKENGEMRYADESIHWWHSVSPEVKGQVPYNFLMSTGNGINWCNYINVWPVKSSFFDPSGEYVIHFYNRQSCVIKISDPSTGNKQHYNTRFLHNSTLRIDLDMNPTIFSMTDLDFSARKKRHVYLTQDNAEDSSAKQSLQMTSQKPTRKPPATTAKPDEQPSTTAPTPTTGKRQILIKHMRQHFYPSSYSVVENPSQDARYFVVMNDLPDHWLQRRGPLLSQKAYTSFTSRCLHDFYSKRLSGSKNAALVVNANGIDTFESIDYPKPVMSRDKSNSGGGTKTIYYFGLHNIPRSGDYARPFFGVDVDKDEDWATFARDGFTFTAFTTIPRSNNTVTVIALAANYIAKQPSNAYDENYPQTFFIKYDTTFVDNSWSLVTTKAPMREVRDMNYVDDIAYLYKCNTILTVFGPIYTEVPVDQFGPEASAPVHSIYELGAYEGVTAIFNEPDTNLLYASLRNELITELEYTCGGEGKKPYVTARKRARYIFPADLQWGSASKDIKRVPEYMLKALNVYRGSVDSQDAADPLQFPLPEDPAAQAGGNLLLLWIFIGIAVLLILLMCLVGVFTVRRRHRRRPKASLGPSMKPTNTNRSGLTSVSGISGSPSVRSSLMRASGRSRATDKSQSRASVRSGLGASGMARSRSNAGSGTTNRSRLTAASSSQHPSRASSLSRSPASGRSRAMASAGPKTIASQTVRSSPSTAANPSKTNRSNASHSKTNPSVATSASKPSSSRHASSSHHSGEHNPRSLSGSRKV